jgi:hypothetical protein
MDTHLHAENLVSLGKVPVIIAVVIDLHHDEHKGREGYRQAEQVERHRQPVTS